MTSTLRFATLALFGTLVAGPAAAETVVLTPEDITSVQSLDEITIAGDRTLSAARKAMIDAEDRFFHRWNAVNTERSFDIRCNIVTPTGTRLSVRVCEPAFVEMAGRFDIARMTRIIEGNFMPNGEIPMQMSLYAEMRRQTLAAIRKDPELLRSLVEHARLKEHYAALRKERFKDRWIVWD